MTSSDVGSFEIRELVLPAGQQVYKVLGNQKTLKAYNEAVCGAKEYSGQPEFDLDWRGMYTQFLKSHVLGTVAYRWSSNQTDNGGYAEANLVEVTLLSPLPTYVCLGAVFRRGDVKAKVKADLVKQTLGLPTDTSLVEALGQQGRALLMEETEGEWELVLSHSLVAQLDFNDDVVAVRACLSLHILTSPWYDLLVEGSARGNLSLRACNVQQAVRRLVQEEECREVLGESTTPQALLDLAQGPLSRHNGASKQADDVAGSEN